MAGSIVAITATAEATAGELTAPCAAVEAVVARGSGQDVGGFNEMRIFKADLVADLDGAASAHVYELGSESQDGSQYPAVDVAHFLNGNALGAESSGGQAYEYGESVHQGIQEPPAAARAILAYRSTAPSATSPNRSGITGPTRSNSGPSGPSARAALPVTG